jgi:hypothetical protein
LSPETGEAGVVQSVCSVSVIPHFLRDCTPGISLKGGMKIQSGLHGDMQRVAEMTTPLHLVIE